MYSFLRDERGQDLIEYTLLLAFVCLVSAALFISAGGSVAGIWMANNSRCACSTATGKLTTS
jgi:Flp pilus assembly pilin Flp